MHLRRALLLFAIVVGLAALAASISRPGNDSPDPVGPAGGDATQTETETHTRPSATPGDTPVAGGGPPATLAFAAAEDQTRRVEAGQAATVEVSVAESGLVSIPLLGLSGAAEPVTPARFDVLVSEQGNYPIVFQPAQGDEEREVGTIEVTEPRG